MFVSISSARVDGLSERRLTATEMIEHFSNREDFLYYRHTTYSKPAAGRRDSPAREIVVSHYPRDSVGTYGSTMGLWGAVCVKIYSRGHLKISGGNLSTFYEAKSWNQIWYI